VHSAVEHQRMQVFTTLELQQPPAVFNILPPFGAKGPPTTLDKLLCGWAFT